MLGGALRRSRKKYKGRPSNYEELVDLRKNEGPREAFGKSHRFTLRRKKAIVINARGGPWIRARKKIYSTL